MLTNTKYKYKKFCIKETKLKEKEPVQNSLKYGMFISSSSKDGDQTTKNDEKSTTSNSANYSNFVSSSSKEEPILNHDPASDLLLLSCGLCAETCKRGIKTDCCSARACRACATKEVTKSHTCWSCNALGLITANLVNDDLLRAAVEHYKTHQTLLPEHRNGLDSWQARKRRKTAEDLMEVKINTAAGGDTTDHGSEKVFEKKVKPSKSNTKTFNTAVGGDMPALGSENVGHKLLEMMGWAGGGLGKDGKGISEPITAHARFGREGLGTEGIPRKGKSHPLVQNKRQRRKKKRQNYEPSVDLNLDYDYPLHSFIVVMLEYRSDEHPCNILKRSGTFSKMAVGWKYYHSPNGDVNCTVHIDNNVVSEFSAYTKEEARDRAAEEAIYILQQHCYTIMIKNEYPRNGKIVDLTEFEGEGEGDFEKEESSFNKYIPEPIIAPSLIGRDGHETEDWLANFTEKATKIMEEYILSSDSDDLVFSTDFDNVQRKQMHQIACKLGLKSKSFGKGEERFLTISRKDVNGMKLLEDLVQQGGVTEKYTVIEPGEPDSDNYV